MSTESVSAPRFAESPGPMPSTVAPLADLSLRGITKRFPGVLANDDINLDVYRGEIHALLGENGAGKSTLMKILYGYYHPDSGTINRKGMPISIRSPREGRQHGIGMVFQNFTLVPAFTVTENIALVLSGVPFVLPMAKLEREVRQLSERYKFGVDPRAVVRELSVGEQQKVEILKLLLTKAEFLIFDEPTSVLAPHEIDELMEVFRTLRQDGLAVLFITHKLREVLATADRITVLRRGAVTATMPAKGATERILVDLMLGVAPGAPTSDGAPAGVPLRSDGPPSPASADVALPARIAGANGTAGAPALEILDADVPDPAGRVHLRNVSLSIHAGEIVGVAAVSGNGQSELGDLVLGLRHCRSGSMRVFGVESVRWSPARVLSLGVGCVPEDPMRHGTVPRMSVLENMILSERKRYAGWGGLSVHWKVAREFVIEALQRFGLRMPALEAQVGGLSGGNVQRVVFARELARRPKLLVSYYPTRGMDVPSATRSREMLLAHRAQGAAILLVSEDLDELFALSDRLAVMHRGQIVGILRPTETTTRAVGLLMTGAEEHHG
jgi:general nucleoside transport system ATP-binding protein